MKIVFLLSILFLSRPAFSVCNNPISRLPVLDRPTSARYNGDLDKLYDALNEVSGDCINENSITSSQLEDNIVTTDKIAANTITASKFASGVIPPFGKPLRIRVFTSGNPVWTKQSDIGSILVQVIGGGGGHSTAGSASSFGTFCVAGGGASGVSGGAGGVSSNGDINISGGAGERNSAMVHHDIDEGTIFFYTSYKGSGGHSFLGNIGSGGSYFHRIGSQSETRFGGGGGAYCAKIIQKESIGPSVAVTIGSGGSGPSNSNPGKPGIVIIYEYGR